MSYSGANQASEAREALGKALASLQDDPNIPEDIMNVAQNIAQAVGALFEAEKASSEPDGKASVKSAIGTLSQTLALLQDVRTQHHGIEVATEVIAKAMSTLYPLTTKSSVPPSAGQAAPAGESQGPAQQPQVPGAPAVPSPPPGQGQQAPGTGAAQPQSGTQGEPHSIEVNIGATTESNFYVGFSGEVSEGGVFVATYEALPVGTPVTMLVTLPGGFDFRMRGTVQFVRDPLDFTAEQEPGMGIRFEELPAKERELVLRFIHKRPPMFYDE